MKQEHIAMISVPVQQWTGLYTKEEALKRGTIFQELDLPFFAETPASGCVCGSGGQIDQREQLLMEIYRTSFALDDLILYLDTHSREAEAQKLRVELLQERKKLMKTYDETYGPLTKDCMGTWNEGALPWEGACV